ncbi:MAG: aminomethyl-transferring glycine dehydrogenase subunit GcvPA [Candidatus Calescibacterium sp.]|nr:aminomethyl-transferring glycine dehydrogenase subunit GcvPA [Candidatus Calescibacterium sp.]MCX7733376.1 aminomethyl-transferring glycine dehydrogenase subunit GcvPA [bacterium]MDW8087482.1 aminomethyl-transferring glycine dehydrogenase subunit GcvPA [Candidatus Calescibacterium sp.]
MDFIPHSERDIKEMLDFIGVNSIEELFYDIPDEFKIKTLGLGKGMDEMEIFLKAYEISKKNKSIPLSFAGCGVYFHYVPAVCDFVSSLPGFFTSYTPYQAEMSQGVMKLIYDFQTSMTELFDMDVSNAGMYGVASALSEACLMASRISRKNKVYVSAGVNPNWLEVIRSYLNIAEVELEIIPLENGRTQIKNRYEILVVQYPNFLGVIEDLEEARKNSDFLIVAVPDPIALALLPPPGQFGADIAVGEGQPLGNYPYLGGAKLGIFLSKKDLIRSMPGRIIGKTLDTEGKTCYAMILQTREQHIRREKATSNICTSTSLLAIRASVFLKYYGADGLKNIATKSIQNSQMLREKIKPVFSAEYFNEFPSYIEVDENKFISEGYLPPIKVEKIIPKFLDPVEFEKLTGIKRNAFLFCTTEMLSTQDIKNALYLLNL